MPLALDEGEKIGLAAVEIGVCELDSLGLVIHAQESLLKGRDLAETIEVELPHEGREILVLEPLSKNLTREALLIVD